MNNPVYVVLFDDGGDLTMQAFSDKNVAMTTYEHERETFGEWDESEVECSLMAYDGKRRTVWLFVVDLL